jgi:AraC-like DNA-binding protein
MSSSFTSVAIGREFRPSRERVPRHRHARGYAAVVLAGGYEEAGERARLRVGPGDVILHGVFEAHLNRIDVAGAEILNIELPGCVEPGLVFATVRDSDALVRAAESDPSTAAEHLLQMLVPATQQLMQDWPDLLARGLIANPNLRLAAWADAHHLSAATLSRGFRQVYGVSPAAFRAQMRGRHAWRSIVSGATSSLAKLAAELGFADQAHMTRSVRSVTGRPAGAWRGDQNVK